MQIEQSIVNCVQGVNKINPSAAFLNWFHGVTRVPQTDLAEELHCFQLRICVKRPNITLSEHDFFSEGSLKNVPFQ